MQFISSTCVCAYIFNNAVRTIILHLYLWTGFGPYLLVGTCDLAVARSAGRMLSFASLLFERCRLQTEDCYSGISKLSNSTVSTIDCHAGMNCVDKLRFNFKISED